jgi:hypothetical protein
MVKAVALFKRRVETPVEEFQVYWCTRHPGVVTKKGEASAMASPK